LIQKSVINRSLHKTETNSFYKHKHIILNKRTSQLRHGRTSCAASFFHASLTVEAALVLPLFLFFMVGMLQLARGMQTECAVRASLWETGKELSKYAYITEYKEEQDWVDKLFGTGALLYTYTSFLGQEGKEYWDNSLVSGGSSGFTFLYSSYLKEDGYLDLVVTYNLRIPFPLTGDIELPQIQRCRVRGWI
jgi:hypothetical protein